MPTLAALATSVGVLAVVATWIFGLGPLAENNLQVWQAFIAWGCHYHCGGKFTGTRNTVACMSFGAFVGMVAVMLAGQMGFAGQLAAPIAVGLGATVIVLASTIPLLATIPASVYGFASIAGLILLGTGVAPTAALVPTILSVVIGAAFGYVSEWLAGALTKKSTAGAIAEKAA
jgi:hypothetical protein